MTIHIYMFLFFVGMTGIFVGYPVFVEVSEERQIAFFVAQAACAINMLFSGLNAWSDIQKALVK
jgi:hypothetical protein